MFSSEFFTKLLLKTLAAAPSIVEDIALAVSQSWGKDHVVQAKKGLEVLNKIFSDAAPVAQSIQEDIQAEQEAP